MDSTIRRSLLFGAHGLNIRDNRTKIITQNANQDDVVNHG